MGRFLFFLLLVANAAFGAHLWLSYQQSAPDLGRRERNAADVRIVSVTPPVTAQKRADEARRQAQALAGAACVEFYSLSATEFTKARDAFAALKLGERLAERRVEEVTRHWVFVPPAKERRLADQAAAQLKRQGITELSIRPDHAISLGVFSTEDAALRFLAQVESKGAKGVQSGPFARETKDLVFLVREPDTELVARLTLMQRDFAGAQLRAVPCPDAAPAGNGKAAGTAAPSAATPAVGPQANAAPAKAP